jgi:hypothetical protein
MQYEEMRKSCSNDREGDLANYTAERKTSVYVTSYNYDKNAWLNHQERLLKEFYRLSDKKYELIACPDKADIILIVDVWENVWEEGIECWIENVGNHPLIKKYPKKSFSISDIDAPVILHHGIYASGEKRLLTRGRVYTGSYSLFFDNLTNPFIDRYVADAKAEVEKRYLFSFIGRQSHPIRSKVFNLAFERSDILVEDSSNYDFFSKLTDRRLDRQKYYFEKLIQSKFSLCPRGSGANSLRLFESMKLGVVPVIISDRWIPPRGIKWTDFSIIVKEKNIHDLEKIIVSFESSYKEMGSMARKAYEENFGKDTYFNFIVDNCIHIQKTQWNPESFYQKINPVFIQALKLKRKVHFRSRINQLLHGLQPVNK